MTETVNIFESFELEENKKFNCRNGRKKMIEKEKTMESFKQEKKTKKSVKIKKKYDNQMQRYLELDSKYEKDCQIKNLNEVVVILEEIKKNDYKLTTKEQEDVFDKIDNQCGRYGIFMKFGNGVKEIIDVFLSLNNFSLRYVCSYLAKDATRQTIWEKRFIERLKNMVSDVDNIWFENLQAIKKKDRKLRCHADGEFSRKKENKGQRDIDFAIHKGELYSEKDIEKSFYFSHKRISNIGSSQKDQFKELVEFAQNATRNNSINEFAIIAVEGDYFTKENMKELNGYIKNKYVRVFYASDIDGISDFIKKNI